MTLRLTRLKGLQRIGIWPFTGLLFFLSGAFWYGCGSDAPADTVDICIFGGTSAGIIAAYAAKMRGHTVALVEPSNHLGGLSSGGLGQTDIGNKFAITGLSRDFYRRVGAYYNAFETWQFEPKVARQVYQDYLDEGGISPLTGHRLTAVNMMGNRIERITLITPSGETRTIAAKVFLDASYEGDLMAMAGVSYAVGRESNETYGETYNGVQMRMNHQFPDGIDPYREPGNPASGLVWGIQDRKLAHRGSGDSLVQAYNFRICLTDSAANRIPITEPEDYRPERYALLLRLIETDTTRSLYSYFIWTPMPNRKTDINNRGGFSTDMIGMNWAYPEADHERRAAIVQAHETYTKGLLYFLGHDPRVPQHIRSEMLKWGYPRDEYPENGHWSPQLYIREARRMVSDYVMTEHHCLGQEIAEDAIGMAAYTMDSHNCQRIVVEKEGQVMVKNEGNVEIGGFPPYPIAYRSLTPRAAECTNLLVPVCLSASHIAFGSIRMEPVFMVLGQSAALAASLAIRAGTSVQKVPVSEVQRILREDPLLDGSPPEVVLDNADSDHFAYTGNWQVQQGHWASKSNQTDHLIFMPGNEEPSRVQVRLPIVEDGDYELYYYYPGMYLPREQGGWAHIDEQADVVPMVIRSGDETYEVNLETAGRERSWIPVGTFPLQAGVPTDLEVVADGLEGYIGADAIMFRKTTVQ